jgi:hypothetical protein
MPATWRARNIASIVLRVSSGPLNVARVKMRFYPRSRPCFDSEPDLRHAFVSIPGFSGFLSDEELTDSAKNALYSTRRLASLRKSCRIFDICFRLWHAIIGVQVVNKDFACSKSYRKESFSTGKRVLDSEKTGKMEKKRKN